MNPGGMSLGGAGLGGAGFVWRGLVFVTFVVMLAAQPSWGWGREGHAVIADIAQAHLSAPATSAVSLLLEEEGNSQLSEVASWADDIRKSEPETAPWHYVDIPLDASGYDAARDCPEQDCVVGQIEHFETVLADQSQPAKTRLEALKFLVHFVGDVHQPLHAENHDDEGGNQVEVTGFDKPHNLHAIWDTTMIEMDNPNAADFAATLDARITPADIQSWSAGTPEDWANESHALAVQAYALLGTPDKGATVAVPQSYIEAEQKVIELQLEKAGIRLAAVLNRIFK